MDSNNCKNCSFDNDTNAIFCQNCGQKLASKKTVKDLVKDLKLGSLAGLGSKGVSVAPIVGIDMDSKNTSKKDIPLVKKRHILEDGSWYCPYCGMKNKKQNSYCNDCAMDRP